MDEKKGRPYGIAVFDSFMFHDDATVSPNESWLSQRLVNEGLNVDCVLSSALSYGISGGQIWISDKEHEWTTADPENLPKFCIARTAQAYPLLFHIRAMGIPCFPDPFAKQFSNDKKSVAALAASLGIPTADSVFANYGSSPHSLEYPMIVKPSNSCEGKNVYKVIDELTREHAEYKVADAAGLDNVIWQRALPTGDDLRVYMFGTRPYFALLRKTDAFKANYENKPEVVELEIDELEEMFPAAVEDAIKIMENMPGETGFSSADFLFDDADGKRTPVLGETSMGNLGTKLLRNRKPQFLEEYLGYIYDKIG